MFAVTLSTIAGFCKRISAEKFNFTKSCWTVRWTEGGLIDGCIPLPTRSLIHNWTDYLCWWRSDCEWLPTSPPLETAQNWSLYESFVWLYHKYVLPLRQRKKCVEINKQWQNNIFCSSFCSSSLLKHLTRFLFSLWEFLLQGSVLRMPISNSLDTETIFQTEIHIKGCLREIRSNL